ncbi:lycopene cyclase family protein [Labedaea rhizosphaerae]|uniref:lycopene cyclase family protein n=1 Tax=Labedaea rhizosphaerae TaxID=598644 RepID=UPI003132B198
MQVADVLVAGAGPAGWALAHACADRGLRTALVAPRPRRVWWQTYGVWADECGPAVAKTVSDAIAFGRREHSLNRRYAILDNDATLRKLSSAPIAVLDDRMTARHDGPLGSTVELASGRLVAAALVIDATGAARDTGRGTGGGAAEQTAVGGYVSDAADLVPPGKALFMDWRGGDGTFLYAVPVGDRVLVEETSLAARPGMALADLRARLARRGLALDPALGEERVRFPLDAPRPRGPAFGAAAGLIHPATGYSVGTSLTLAPSVADAIAEALPRGPVAARHAVRQTVWPRSARLVHALRRKGLRALLRMPPARLPDFFDAFFALPAELQHAYLSGRTDVRGTVAAMAALFGSSSWAVKRDLAR